MVFTCSTKPLVAAVSQVVVDSNINKFFRKSGIIQLTADRKNLRINSEASYIVSEATVFGAGNQDEETTIFVDAAQFKKLISTFTSDTVSLEYTDTALVIRSGKSKFTVAKMVDESEMALNRPFNDVDAIAPIILSDEKWKFIKNRQMFAVSEGTAHPIYRYVWFGKDGDVLTGDYDSSLFTRSKSGDMPTTCLISGTIINLLVNLPKTEIKLYPHDENYIVVLTTDSYKFVSEFTPQYESENIGSYSSDIILDMCSYATNDDAVELPCDAVSRFLNQLDILNTLPDAVITLSVDGSECTMAGKTSEIKFEIKPQTTSYSVNFKLSTLKSVISKYSNTINVFPYNQEGETVGIRITDGEMVTVLGGAE